MTHILIPREPSAALLRPFIGCNTQELHEAWAAMVRIAEVQHARDGRSCLAQIDEPAGAAPAAVAGAVAAGWRLVPATPTREWIASVADGGYEDCDCASLIADILSRAPAAPALEAPAAPMREVLTDGQITDALWRTHLRWMEQCGIDTEGMRPTGTWLEHWLIYARAVERAALAAAPQAPAAPSQGSEGWAIDKSTGTDILVYKGCSVIEDEQAHRLLALLSAAPAAPAVDAWLQPDDMAALQRFHETAEDDESYDIGKEAVARLCAFGCLQSHSFGRYSTTDFGDYLLDTWAGARTLPFTTAAEREALAAQAAAKGEHDAAN